MGGIDSLFFLKVLCDLERKKIDTVPDDEFVKEASAPTELPNGSGTAPCVVKVYMHKRYGIGGPLGSKRYACPKCSCLFGHKRYLRQHLQFHCHHKCLGCSECYANIRTSFHQVCGEEQKHPKAFCCSSCPCSFLTKAGLAVHQECHPQSDQVFKCGSCSKKFDNSLELDQHQETHRTQKRWKCKKCPVTFSSASNRSRHTRLKHSKEDEKPSLAQLDNCGSSNQGSSHGDVKEEVEDDEDDEDISVVKANSRECGLCDQLFRHVPLNQSHVCSKFPSPDSLTEDVFNGCFQCPACSQTFSSYIALKLHWGAHLGQEPLTCTNCDKTYSSLRRINTHFELHGTNTCEKCGVFFYKKLAMMLHHCGYTQRCFTCDQVFPTESDYRRHQELHPLPKNFVYKCTECKKFFAKESYFRAHHIEHTGKQPFECSLCHQKFLLFGPFKRHVVKHFFNYKIKCHTCNLSFRSAKAFETHSASHVVKVEFLTCDKCYTQFETDSSFRAHECCVSEEAPSTTPTTPEDGTKTSGFQCEECSTVFRQHHQLLMHLRNQHGQAPPFLLHCDLCSKGFYHRLHLNAHRAFCSKRNEDERKEVLVKKELEQLTKATGRQFQCPQCSRKYFTQWRLDEHMYIHRDPSECPYQCPKCGAGFPRESVLKLHVDKCKNDKNTLRCKECGAAFLNEKTLARHVKVHGKELECALCHDKFMTKRGYAVHQTLCTPESAQYKTFRKPSKPPPEYTCPTCDRRYKLKHRFDAHVASHQGIARYQCPTCFHRFLSATNFKRHVCAFQLKDEPTTP